MTSRSDRKDVARKIRGQESRNRRKKERKNPSERGWNQGIRGRVVKRRADDGERKEMAKKEKEKKSTSHPKSGP